MNRTVRDLVVGCAMAGTAFGACAQEQRGSLFERPVAGAGVLMAPQPSAGASVYSLGLHTVRPYQPRAFAMHDLVQVIINENSTQSSSQKHDSSKEFDTDATLRAFLDLAQLAELRLQEGGGGARDLLDASASREFKGSGSASRSDRFVDRVTATVVDVKPNGTLLLEARVVRGSGKEVTTLVLSGLCRAEDITRQGTVLSHQLASLTLYVTHEGDLARSTRKGPITRGLESVMAF